MDPLTGTVIGFLAVPSSIVSMGVAMMVGRRLAPARRVKTVIVTLFVVAVACVASGGYVMVSGRNTSAFPFAMWGYLPMFVAMGLNFGQSDRLKADLRKEKAAAELAAWRKQLELDTAASAGLAVLAFDLVKIGEICSNELGQDAEALAAYEEAFAIYSKELSSHPLQLNFLRDFYKLLLKVGASKRTGEVGEYWNKVGASWRRLRGDDE